MQFEYPENSLAGFELAVADSWVQTWDVYFGDLGEHAEWYLQIASHIPVPDILVYLRVSPAVAAERLLRRSGGGPAAAGGWDETALLPRLTEQCARYDEVMADTDCVVVDADAPASTVFAQVTALVRGAGVGLGIRTD